MKNLIIKIIFLVSSFANLSLLSNTYRDLKENFKLELFRRQEGLMEKKQYFSLIEPFLNRGERELEVIKQLCMKNPNSNLCDEYFERLISYNLAFFHFHVSGNKYRNIRLVQASNDLHVVIQKIKNSELKDLNDLKEINFTKNLFNEANVSYYKKLNLKNKLSLKFMHAII